MPASRQKVPEGAVREGLNTVVESLTSPEPDAVAEERERRAAMWQALLQAGDPDALLPSVLQDAGAYGGGRGIWTDKATTSGIGGAEAVAVSVLHTGSHYADDLSDEALLYHYPETKRPGRDAMEVEALKAAHRLRLPIFVILKEGKQRSVSPGWVTDWDDPSKLFLVEFNEAEVSPTGTLEPPVLYGHKSGKKTTAKTRPNQQRFRMSVLKRYGPCCAVCDVAAPELLEAAHIIPVGSDGSDDPRNGLVLCRNHHRAFDLGLFCIDPSGAVVIADSAGPADIGLRKLSLAALPQQPAPEALAARFGSSGNP